MSPKPTSEATKATALALPDSASLDMQREELMKGASKLASKARADSTWKAYQSDIRGFEEFCKSHDLCSMPASPETLCMFIAYLDEKQEQKVSTIQRAVSAISQAHLLSKKTNPRNSPLVAEVLKGLRRTGRTGVSKKDALTMSKLRKMMQTMSSTSRGMRDRCILLFGIATGLRRSEIANLDLKDVVLVREGMLITLGVTKTFQEGESEPLAVLYGVKPDTCPVRAMQDWLRARGDTPGPLFFDVTKTGRIKEQRMSDKAVCRLIKRMGKAIGLTEQEISQLGGHSLRSGFITTASELGTPLQEIQTTSRHRRLEILIGYIRTANIWNNNATRGITDAD